MKKKLISTTDHPIPTVQVDIEGSEVKAVRNWIETGALDRVDQIGMELHLFVDDPKDFTVAQKVSLAKRTAKPVFLELVQSLYRIGFRLIAWAPNIGVPIKDKRLQAMEVVFKRNNSGICEGYQT